MNRHIYRYSFSSTLKTVLEVYEISNYQLSKISGLDPAHISRLVSGKRNRPRGTTMHRLTLGLARLGVSDVDISMLMRSAGFDPGVEVDLPDVTQRRRRPVRKRQPSPALRDLSTAEPQFRASNLPPRSSVGTGAVTPLPEKLKVGDPDGMRKLLDDLKSGRFAPLKKRAS